MPDETPIPDGGASGWLATVTRSKHQAPMRYYVALSEKASAVGAIRTFLKLRDTCQVELRYALSREDMHSLKLRPGQIRKA